MARFSDLPKEVVVEILSWLPVESLIRFKCVRKSWYALIKKPKFVDKHLANQIQISSIKNNRNNLCILFKHDVLTNAGEEITVLSLHSYYNKTETTLANGDVGVIVKNMNLHHDEISHYIEMMGHCNGLICLANYNDDLNVILVNPAIREFRFLPESSCLPTPPPHYSTKVGRFTDGVGFGYDPKTDDYKVVRIVTFREAYGYVNSRRVEVYTLSTDSWREINNVVIEASIFWTPCFQIYFNGVFYWWALDDNSNTKDVILAFDLSDEVFQKIPMPDSFFFNDENCRSLGELNESLALFNYHALLFEKNFDIWVMDEFGVNGIWSKILTIGPLQGIDRPLVFWKNDELLLGDNNWQVVSYNLNTKEIKNHLTGHGVFENVSAVVYVRRLFSVKGGNKLATGDNTCAVLSGME